MRSDPRSPAGGHFITQIFILLPFLHGLKELCILFIGGLLHRTSFTFLHLFPLLRELMLFVGCLTSQQQASVSQGRICSDNFTCCHTEIEVADQTFYLTQSQYTDTGPTSPSADPITPGAWQGSHWSANFEVTGMTQPKKIPAQAGFKPCMLMCEREKERKGEGVERRELGESGWSVCRWIKYTTKIFSV